MTPAGVRVINNHTSDQVPHQTFVSLPAERDRAAPFARPLRSMLMVALVGVFVLLSPGDWTGHRPDGAGDAPLIGALGQRRLVSVT